MSEPVLSSPPPPWWVNPISRHPKPPHASPNTISGTPSGSHQPGEGLTVLGGTPLQEPGNSRGGIGHCPGKGGWVAGGGRLLPVFSGEGEGIQA